MSTNTDRYAPPTFSHAGIFVHDFEAMAGFYRRLLGYTVTDSGSMPVPDSDPPRLQQVLFLSNDPSEHHQVILISGRPREVGFNVINQLSFRVRSLGELRAIRSRLKDEPVSDVRPIVHGNAWSLYVRDPEGNRLEFYLDTPWYISQPCREPLDLDAPDDVILRETEALCRGRPGFRPRDDWMREMEHRMRGAGQHASAS